MSGDDLPPDEPLPWGEESAGPSTHERGREGEEEGVRWLVAQGYDPLDQNVRNEAGEIDLIAREGDTLCFVEIKARLTPVYGEAVEAVGPHKQRKISRAAILYLAESKVPECPCRFDVLGLDWIEGAWRYTLVRDAFPFRGRR